MGNSSACHCRPRRSVKDGPPTLIRIESTSSPLGPGDETRVGTEEGATIGLNVGFLEGGVEADGKEEGTQVRN